jgi:hypothetical protein
MPLSFIIIAIIITPSLSILSITIAIFLILISISRLMLSLKEDLHISLTLIKTFSPSYQHY